MTAIITKVVERGPDSGPEAVEPTRQIVPGGVAVEAFLRAYYGPNASEKLHNKKRQELQEMYRSVVYGLVDRTLANGEAPEV